MKYHRIHETNVFEESCLRMFKLMTIIVQTTLITSTKGFANVAKHVIRNITTFSFNFNASIVLGLLA